MRVALVHDYIKEYGGAERVLEALHKIWPQAPVYTSIYLPEYLGPHKERFEDWKIITSKFQNLPFNEKMISPMRMLSPLIFGSWDFSGYDAVIVSATGAYISNLINKGNALQVCYCHTPPRYLYGYPTARNWKKTLLGRAAGELVNHRLRLTDYTASQRVDYYIANSDEVRSRIRKFYRREAKVIYPPVKIADKVKNPPSPRLRRAKGEYYLEGGRRGRAKHIDLVIRAANKLKFRLKIFGRAFAGMGGELRKISGPTVEFLGEVDEKKLYEIYRDCRALIYSSEDEDFGIMPVEAQANGVGVIAYRSGGVTESVIEGKTGIFFEELTVESLEAAIRKLGTVKIDPINCYKNSEKFSETRFKKEIIDFMTNRLRLKLRRSKYA